LQLHVVQLPGELLDAGVIELAVIAGQHLRADLDAISAYRFFPRIGRQRS
jgi:hypothetical protein